MPWEIYDLNYVAASGWDNNEDAENWRIMPEKQLGCEPLGFKEYKYEPLFAPVYNKLNTDRDKFILESLNNFKSEQCEKSKQREERMSISPLQNK